MAKLSWWALVPAAATLLSSACSVPESTSDLVPEGPPYVRQFFLDEIDAGRHSILAFGWHPNVLNARDGENGIDRTHPATKAAVSSQEFRIVVDELLIGNNLEEIECRDRTFSRVPLGATPDDIANCSVANDLLTTFCKGDHMVCTDAAGVPRGVLDADENGSADNTRLIAGAVTIRCGTIDVPVSQESSFWQPAGNQLVPAEQSPAKSLGPAIIVVPVNGDLPSNSDCTISLAAEVVDKDLIRPCTPTGGMEDTDDVGDCTPGELAGLAFHTETIALDSSVPANNSTGVSLTRRTTKFTLTAEPDVDSVATATATVMQGATARTDVTIAINSSSDRAVDVTLGADLIASTVYTFTLSNLKDKFGLTIAPMTVTFTTAP